VLILALWAAALVALAIAELGIRREERTTFDFVGQGNNGGEAPIRPSPPAPFTEKGAASGTTTIPRVREPGDSRRTSYS
jgi:hypothetical protein